MPRGGPPEEIAALRGSWLSLGRREPAIAGIDLFLLWNLCIIKGEDSGGSEGSRFGRRGGFDHL